MMFRPLTIFIMVAMTLLSAMAQTAQTAVAPDEYTGSIVEKLTNPAGYITIVAPERLLERALPVAEAQTPKPEEATSTDDATGEQEKTVRQRGKVAGYRVQVYADNNARVAKGEARQRERALSREFAQYDTYVTYASPYWRLRVGDFRSQYEAEKVAAEIKKAFPNYAKEVRVVRDHVNAH